MYLTGDLPISMFWNLRMSHGNPSLCKAGTSVRPDPALPDLQSAESQLECMLVPVNARSSVISALSSASGNRTSLNG